MPKAQAQGFHFLAVGAPLLNAVGLSQLVQAIDDFNRQFTIGRIGDVLFLNGRVDVNRVLLSGFTVQPDTDLKEFINAVRTVRFLK